MIAYSEGKADWLCYITCYQLVQDENDLIYIIGPTHR